LEPRVRLLSSFGSIDLASLIEKKGLNLRDLGSYINNPGKR
jgi:hypothetical protein